MEEHPDLLGLLRGELTNVQVSAVADHLDTCRECHAQLSEVAIGHALLTGASRTLTDRPEPLETPVPAAFDRGLVARDRRERWLRPTLLLAAAAVLVAGTVGVTNQLNRPETPAVAASRTAVLEPIEGNARGEVVMADTADDVVQMTIDTEDLPSLPAGEFYYAWLLDPDTNKMLPLGQIGPGGTATFELSVSLINEYSAVDISLEYDDGDPEHSPRSVLRAVYT